MAALEEVDTVVVGSGFGGSPIALRLAQAGVQVRVLERGRAWPPGSFPRSPAGVNRNFWDPAEGLYGLFNPWSFRHLEAIVSSGLGGGSLIYANVLLRKDRAWFDEAGGYRWPIDYDTLEPYYERAEAAIGVERYPFEREPYASTPKTVAFRDAAQRVAAKSDEQIEWGLPNLAVSFTPQGQDPALGVPIPEAAGEENLHGLPRYTCRLVGECDLGCNLGAKNSLDYTYLSAARHAGAEIQTLSEVRAIQAAPGGGYLVDYDRHDPDANRLVPAPKTRHRIHARCLVVAAGAIGSTYLLLRNRAALPGLSGALGTRFSGNGDFLGFARSCDTTTDVGERPTSLNPSRGPVITSYMRMPDGADEGSGAARDARGFYIEDAGWPEFVNWMVQGIDVPKMAWRAGSHLRRTLRDRFVDDPDSDVGSELSRILGSAALTDTTLGMLGMGRDVPDGRMRLRGRSRLDVDWSTQTSQAFLDRMTETMRLIARELGGAYMESPGYNVAGRLITVHPLGGCPMGRDRDEGVVDTYGRVFGHDDLYVSDGSVMPGPVGANPALTIAAFAERCAAQIVEEL